MDEVEALFDACFEDRADEVADAIRNTPAVIHARRIGGRTPLHQAAFGGAERVVSLLIASGADVNATTDYGWVPLHYAAAPESPAVAEILVRHGARVDVANGDGSTPLHHAADFGKDAVVDLLLSHGANPNARDSDGHTPLNYVELDSEIARMLRSRGAEAGDAIPSQPEVDPPAWLAGNEAAVRQAGDIVNKQWNAANPKGDGETR